MHFYQHRCAHLKSRNIINPSLKLFGSSTREATYVWRNTETRTLYHFYRGNQSVLHISVRVWVSVHVCVRVNVGVPALACACARLALLIQHATRMRYIFCSVSPCTRFFDVILQTARFSKKKSHKNRTFTWNIFNVCVCVVD